MICMLITVTIHFFESYLNHGTYLLCMTHVVLGECLNFYVNKRALYNYYYQFVE